ncbi:hypothetical protein F0M18_16865 [Pseudohalioglobus sediminis]|uniref:Uncharacterized protein n=1 Tax=Pseudohalioglobus sediminis TaxID=2606449 RepID=A0A5B0WRD5_9GAMM|nr:hypothetical protein [Pseudohalioglobus sediminis]KAA1188875.1 hypothetical protein F0M18_16865 [Pseudohalioglobus sediminis]
MKDTIYISFLFRPTLLVFFVLIGISGAARADTWQPVTSPEQLQQIMSDTRMSATLKEGITATGQYNADGTGTVSAWGETFQRRWHINADNTLCIDYGKRQDCLKVEQHTTRDGLYRATNLATGASQEFSVQRQGEPLVLTSPAARQGSAAAPSADELAKSLANPNTPLATLNFKLQYRTFDGDLPGASDESGTSLLFQPAFPFPLDNGDTVFFRPAFPIQFDQSIFEGEAGFDSVSGLGDIAFDLAYGRTNKETGLVWAAGMIASLPTATEDELGFDRWTAGPELLVAKLSANAVLGALTTYQTDFAGSGDLDVSTFTVNAIAIFLPGGGWNVGTVPIMTYDEENSQWTVPVNLQVGKTVILGGRPWKFGVEVNYYVEQADAFGPEWMVGFNFGPVVDNIFAGWF